MSKCFYMGLDLFSFLASICYSGLPVPVFLMKDRLVSMNHFDVVNEQSNYYEPAWYSYMYLNATFYFIGNISENTWIINATVNGRILITHRNSNQGFL